MAGRLTLFGRLAVTVLLVLAALWLLVLARGYRQQARDTLPEPTPAAVGALAQLAPGLATERWPQLAALLGAGVRLHAEDDAELAAALPGCFRRDSAAEAAYRGALPAGVLLQAWTCSDGGPSRLARWLGAEPTVQRRLRLQLPDSRVLLVDASDTVPGRRGGVPAGFGAGLLATLLALGALVPLYLSLRPLARLAQAVERLDPGGEPVPLPAPSPLAPPELRSLIAAFAALQDRLGLLVKARIALLGGIGHDVRSFATRLRLRVEALPDAEERARAVADIAAMIRLLDDALLTARAGAQELAEELVEPAALLRAEAADRGSACTLTVAPEAETATILADPLALRRILANLCDNAIAYGQIAHLSLQLVGDRVELAVADEGPGIPPDKRALLLEPFTRLEASRSRHTGGAGLGLAVVRSLTEAQHAELILGATPAGGAKVAVRFPRFTS